MKLLEPQWPCRWSKVASRNANMEAGRLRAKKSDFTSATQTTFSIPRTTCRIRDASFKIIFCLQTRDLNSLSCFIGLLRQIPHSEVSGSARSEPSYFPIGTLTENSPTTLHHCKMPAYLPTADDFSGVLAGAPQGLGSSGHAVWVLGAPVRPLPSLAQVPQSGFSASPKGHAHPS
jgi:hypothetical protein